MLDVKLKSNGDYWQAYWSKPGGGRWVRSIGSKSRFSKRQANAICRQLSVDLEREERKGSTPRLSEWLASYIASRTDVKDTTAGTYRDAEFYLLRYFDNDPAIDTITRADAAEWRVAVASGELGIGADGKIERRKPSEPTVCRHVRAARLIFAEALDRDLVLFNPFDRLKGNPPKIKKTWRDLDRDAMDKIFDTCPNLSWRVLFGLCRYAGLRRGEALRLKWGHIQWSGNRMTVNADTEQETTKEATRVAPIEPAKCPSGLTKLLREAMEAAPPGTELVCHAVKENNLRRTALSIIKRAGVTKYAKPFHTLRKNCETEWAQQYPQHVVSEWIGHDITVSQDHYLKVPEELFSAPREAQIVPFVPIPGRTANEPAANP